jgi:hypothetical protein
LLETGAAALLFAVVFLAGNHIHPLRALVRDRRQVISFAAGMTAAYVFVHLLPELHEARQSYAESAPLPLPFEGRSIYLVALVGFLVSYGMDYVGGKRGELAEARHEHLIGRVHIGSFAVYVALMSYLLVHGLEDGTTQQLVLYATAVAVHFLTIDHALREEYAEDYGRAGRLLLAAACLVGWGAGIAFALPHYVLALLVAFIAGSVIMNSLITELPEKKDGRFLPFVIGGLLYGLVLIGLG